MYAVTQLTERSQGCSQAPHIGRTLAYCLLSMLLAALGLAGTATDAVPAATPVVPLATPPLIPSDSATPLPPNGPDAVSKAALGQVTVEAPEPRFVAPTRRDRIGRIWAPVFIDGKGPFRLALDSCADTNGITKRVAQALGLAGQGVRMVRLRGGVGSATVPMVPVTSFNVGDLSLGHTELPIVPDALGGADGILGTSRMGGRRIMIDFRHDLITITRSHGQRAPIGFLTVPFEITRPELIVLDAYIGSVKAKAIIDTGGQVSIANLALRNALERRRREQDKQADRIEDVTKTFMPADSVQSPTIEIAVQNGKTIQISNDRLMFADMAIFQRWKLNSEPTVLIGMNTLGQLDMLIIDYQRKELQIRMNNNGA